MTTSTLGSGARGWLVMLAMMVACAVAIPAKANNYLDGMIAFDKGNYALARKVWMKGARERDAKSLFGLGQLYELGYGVDADPVKAHALYDIAAMSGSRPAARARDSMGATLSGDERDASLRIARKLRNGGPSIDEVLGGDAVGSVASAAQPREVEAGKARESKQAKKAAKKAAKKERKAKKKERKQAAAAQGAGHQQPAGPRLEPSRALARGGESAAALLLEPICDLTPDWEDAGSGGGSDVGLFRPRSSSTRRIVGGYAQGRHGDGFGCVGGLAPGRRDGGNALLAAPVGWERVWADRGSGAYQDGSIWRARSPDPDFVCLGHVAQRGYSEPSVSGYVCVNRCMVRDVPVGNPVWTSQGTGARESVVIHVLPISGAFVAVAGVSYASRLTDLDPQASCLYR